MKIKLARQAHAEMVRGVFRLFAGRKPTLKELEKFVASRASRDAVKAYAIANGLKDVKSSVSSSTQPYIFENEIRSRASSSDLPGVMFRAHWHMPGNGLCDAYRRLARALYFTGTRVRLEGYRTQYPRWFSNENVATSEIRREVQGLLDTQVHEVARINAFAYFTADGTTVPFMSKVVMRDEDRLSGYEDRTIFYTMLEMYNCWPLETVPLLNRARELWVPCSANVQACVRSGVMPEKVVRVPVPYFEDDPRLALVERKRAAGVPHLYHIGSIEPRKDQGSLLRCFLLAIKPGDAILRIKGRQANAAALARIRAYLLEEPEVRAAGWNASAFDKYVQLIAEEWSEQQITDLHAWGDVYICASHGEGWNMPARDAKLAGNRMVHVASGGSEDFAGLYDLTIPVTRTGPSNIPGASWWCFDYDKVTEQIRQSVYDFRDTHIRDVDLTEQRADVVGKQMLSRLRNLGASV
jgi:hypothetical protein